MDTKEKIILAVLLLATFSLRFISLGYSDYISDEPGTFMHRGGGKNPELSTKEYLLVQRKGPMQIFVGFLPLAIVGNYNNELAQRIPFSIYSAAAIFVFYETIKLLTKNRYIAFVSAFLLATNGLISAYGRIAQYQNLNLFFSFASLYFYSRLLDTRQAHLKNSLLGTAMFCISFLSHWDAVYILIPVSLVYIKFLLNKNLSPKKKMGITLANLMLGSLLLLPFMIPYVKTYLGNSDNQEYVGGIIGGGGPLTQRVDIKQFYLYNPFLTFWTYVIGSIVGIFAVGIHFFKTLVKKTETLFSKDNVLWIFPTWLIIILLVFRYFIDYSGLHFYNIFIPAVVLCAVAFYWAAHLIPKLKLPVTFIAATILIFFYYQSYVLFVDHKREYPMEQEKVLWLKTKSVEQGEELRHRTGFPHKRYWKEINAWVIEQNEINNERFGYTTNEYDSLTRFYMSADRRTSNGFYAIGVKKPLSLARDYSFPQIKNKKTVHKVMNDEGETVVKIYRIEDD